MYEYYLLKIEKKNNRKHFSISFDDILELNGDGQLTNEYSIIICKSTKDIEIKMPNYDSYDYPFIEIKNMSDVYSVKITTNNAKFGSNGKFSLTLNNRQYMLAPNKHVKFFKYQKEQSWAFYN